MQCYFCPREDGHNIAPFPKTERGAGASAHRHSVFVALVAAVPNRSGPLTQQGSTIRWCCYDFWSVVAQDVAKSRKINLSNSNGRDLRIAELRFRVCECVRNMDLPPQQEKSSSADEKT